MKPPIIPVTLFVAIPVAPFLAAPVFAAPAGAAADPCLDCHRKKTPGAVRLWQASAHAPKVGCADCHGRDHQRMLKGEVYVDAKVCGRCHPKALREHTRSRHGMGLHSGWGCTRALARRDPAECRFCHAKGSAKPVSRVQCARFLKQSSEMGQAGCNRCHEVERSCAACHSKHGTAAAIVRDPNVCSKCHMGPDHPQWEMWQTSRHGTLFASVGRPAGAACQDCHLAANSHDVSRGLTMSPMGKIYPKKKFNKRRRQMLAVCQRCHARGFARRDLERADRIRRQSMALVAEAERIIRDLADHGLLDPMPADRPPHPQRGKVLVLDGQILYEDTSRIERLLFKMKKYDLAQTVKGAYHQNPAYTHWYGNAELKMTLVEIKAEAARLRALGKRATSAPPPGKGSGAGTSARQIEAELEALKRKRERGALTPAAYRAAKRRLLERFLR